MKKKKSLGTRITLAIMLVLAYGILSAGITGMVCLVKQSQDDMKNSMSERVAAASNLVSSTVRHYSSIITALDGTTAQANNIIASDPSITAINTRANGAAGVTTDPNGYIVITGEYSNGTASITTNTEWLANVINTMHASESTEFYLVNNAGDIMASINGSLTAGDISKYLDSTSIQVANLGGRSRIIYSSEVKGTDWTALVCCNTSEFNGNATGALIIMICSTALSFVLGVIVVRRFVRRVTGPLQIVNDRILGMAAGNLSAGKVDVHTGDEIQTLAEAVNSMSEYTGRIIRDIKDVSAKIAAEDLTAEPREEYIGDYIPIKEALIGIIESTSGIIRQINESSRLVSDGSARMSDNSTTLSQAANEQAATVEELNASVVEISSNITANAESAAKAKVLAGDCRAIVDEGNVKMNDMVQAMEEINETSSQIANIIKTIEDISFQTNILSLNASIEAARAGEAGKGFAVVAGEVGQLAGKTAEAAKTTTSLIKTALVAVENGTVMANETAKMLKKIVAETDDTAKVIDQIAEASQEQADSVKQILVGMDQISTSVQMTSGSSAECAASAEELSAQAKVLLELVDKFKVSSGGARIAPRPAAAAPAEPVPAAPAKKPAEAPKPVQKPAEKPVVSAVKSPEKPAAKPEVKPAEKTAPAKTDAKPPVNEKNEKNEKKPEVKPAPAKSAPSTSKPAAAKPVSAAKPAPAPAKPAPSPAKPAPSPAKPAPVNSAVPAAKKPSDPGAGAVNKAPKRMIVLDDDKY